VKVEQHPWEVGEEESGDDGHEYHGHLVLSLAPARVGCLQSVPQSRVSAAVSVARRGGPAILKILHFD